MQETSINLNPYLHLLPFIQSTQGKSVWMTYDDTADTLYINYEKPSTADDSELTDDDLIVRTKNGEIVGITILHASSRAK